MCIKIAKKHTLMGLKSKKIKLVPLNTLIWYNIYDLRGEFMAKLYKREKYLSKIRSFYHTTDLIKVLSGIRRCGKSSIMQLIAKELIKNGVDKKNIIFIIISY